MTTSRSRVTLSLVGHLTEDTLEAALKRADAEIYAAKARLVLVVDCLTMTGYDSAARSLFVSWNSHHKNDFAGVAVITRNSLWHMVVGSMSFASGQKMRAFDTLSDSTVWIEAQLATKA